MKGIIAIVLVLTLVPPAVAGFKPSKIGGPGSSRGSGTRVLSPKHPTLLMLTFVKSGISVY